MPGILIPKVSGHPFFFLEIFLETTLIIAERLFCVYICCGFPSKPILFINSTISFIICLFSFQTQIFLHSSSFYTFSINLLIGYIIQIGARCCQFLCGILAIIYHNFFVFLKLFLRFKVLVLSLNIIEASDRVNDLIYCSLFGSFLYLLKVVNLDKLILFLVQYSVLSCTNFFCNNFFHFF